MKTNNLPLNRLSFTANFYSELGAMSKNIYTKRKRAYWLSQITGWGIFAIVNIVLMALFDRLNFKELIVVFFTVIVGISTTHLFRGIISKNGWVNLPLKKIIPRLIISSVIIGTVIYLLILGAEFSLGVFRISKFKIGMPLAGSISIQRDYPYYGH